MIFRLWFTWLTKKQAKRLRWSTPLARWWSIIMWTPSKTMVTWSLTSLPTTIPAFMRCSTWASWRKLLVPNIKTPANQVIKGLQFPFTLTRWVRQQLEWISTCIFIFILFIFNLTCLVLQRVAIGENMVKLKYTKASAVKEKEGKLVCQAEVLCEGKPIKSSLISISSLVYLFSQHLVTFTFSSSPFSITSFFKLFLTLFAFVLWILRNPPFCVLSLSSFNLWAFNLLVYIYKYPFYFVFGRTKPCDFYFRQILSYPESTMTSMAWSTGLSMETLWMNLH